MMNLLESPRIRELLDEAERAVEMLQSPTEARADVNEALDSIYRDLGRYVHGLARQDKSGRVQNHMRGDSPEPLARDRVEPVARGWYTDEVDLDSARLFTDDELDDVTDIPEPDSLLRDDDTVADDTPRAVTLIPTLEDDALTDGGSLHSLRSAPFPPWEGLLASFLELLVPPDDLLDSHAMPEEASKVQWASGELNGRLPELPETVQLAVVGLLAARARNLQAHVDLDIGPRMALDRLKRYREVAELPWVAGLLPGARPERDTWAEDALVFWNLLRPQSPL